MGIADKYIRDAQKRGKEIDKSTLDSLLNDDKNKREHWTKRINQIITPGNLRALCAILVVIFTAVCFLTGQIDWFKYSKNGTLIEAKKQLP